MAHGLTTLFGFTLVDGAGAVWIFFSISGFLITLALNKKYDSGARSLVYFYWNRVIRLFPTYWVWLVVTLLVYFLLPPEYVSYQAVKISGSTEVTGFWQLYAEISSVGTLLLAAIANLFGIFIDGFLYTAVEPFTGRLVGNPTQSAPIWAYGFIAIGQYWSIGVELIFYCIAPFLVTRLWLIAPICLISVLGYAETAWVSASMFFHLPSPIVFIQTPKFIWMFMLGACLAHVYFAWQDKRRLHLWLLIGLLALVYALTCIRASALFPIQSFPWWIFCVVTAFVPILFHMTRDAKWDRFFGDLSYPVYVNHFLIIQIAGSMFHPSGWIFATLSCGAAIALVVLVERPARRFKWRE